MGIFSLFGKKERQPEETPADKASLRKKREEAAIREAANNTETKTVQRKAAHATAMKIDAIESEMSSEFVRPITPSANTTLPGPVSQIKPADQAVKIPTLITPKKTDSWEPPATFQPTLPAMGSTTEFLLNTEAGSNPAVALSASEATPVIEEAAILFANDQTTMVEHVLQAAISEDALGHATLTVWRMLFDLYQISGNQPQFDNLSIEFANKFETSPPAWIESDQANKPAVSSAPTGATPSISFSGVLDASIVKQLEKAQNLAEKSRVLRLEFARVTSVDPIGCGLLLSILKKLQKSGHDLILVGALEMVGKIRSILEVGRRDETEAPWLLLLEILRLLNLEKDFEEASIDYCVTFEVSPPAFVAPKNKVTMAVEETPPPPSADHFAMPTVIADGTDKLVNSIASYAGNHNPAIIDCSQLKRVDFGAAGQLLTGLAPLAAKGANIELHNVNHLVAALFTVMGLKDIVRVVLRKS
ncbi:MAG TPA: STAS domain-containing protein [Burkholderiaceae bacterium]|nr:STAS domain-containing protein [Burkholderiaceae bacterium]